MLYAVLLRYLMTLNVIDGAVFSIVAVCGWWRQDILYCIPHSFYKSNKERAHPAVSTEQAGRVTTADCNYLGMCSARLRGQSTDPARDLDISLYEGQHWSSQLPMLFLLTRRICPQSRVSPAEARL